jgi:pimeloyl-ACP methyl ester carboxylesterase
MSGQPPAEAGAGTAPQSLRLPHVSPGHLAWLRKLFAVLQAVSPATAARAAFHLFLRTFRHPVGAEDAAALARARRHRLMAGADPFVVHEWGSGPRTVVILHGWGSNAARFVRLAEALQARGWHVLVPDAPGHGASPGRSSSLPQFMAALDAVVARFGPPQALVGHSLGALGIAWRHAAGPPDWAGNLSAVALVSMPSGAPFLVKVFLDALGLGPATRTRLEALFHRRFGADIPSFAALPGATRIAGRLLLVHDGGDDVVPYVHTRQLLEQLPQAEVVTTSQLGHSALTRDAATIDRIVQFFEQET